MTHKITELELFQKQWNNWCDEQFKYMKQWSEDIAWEIIHNQEDGFPMNLKKVTSVIMESMWRNK